MTDVELRASWSRRKRWTVEACESLIVNYLSSMRGIPHDQAKASLVIFEDAIVDSDVGVVRTSWRFLRGKA